MRSRSFGSIRKVLAGVIAAGALGSIGCVESGSYEKAAAELNQARQASWQKDQRIRALEWYYASMNQQVQANRARDEAAQRDLAAKIAELEAANAALAERLKKKDEEQQRGGGYPFALADDGAKDGAAARKAAAAPLKPDEMRRLLASIEARNAKLAESLARVERLLQEQADRENKGAPRPARRTINGDLVDPWGFGERK